MKNIYLPAKHICNYKCQYIYYIGFVVGENNNYWHWYNSCDWYDKICQNKSLILSSYNNNMWLNSDSGWIYLKPNEVVISEANIKILFNYPLKNSVTFSFNSESGFTRKKLVDIIVKTYKQIYDENPEKYDIYKYGLDLDELYLNGILYDQINNLVKLIMISK